MRSAETDAEGRAPRRKRSVPRLPSRRAVSAPGCSTRSRAPPARVPARSAGRSGLSATGWSSPGGKTPGAAPHGDSAGGILTLSAPPGGGATAQPPAGLALTSRCAPSLRASSRARAAGQGVVEQRSRAALINRARSRRPRAGRGRLAQAVGGGGVHASDGYCQARALLPRCGRSGHRQERPQALQRLHRPQAFDLLICGQAATKANGRDIIESFDLPIAKGMQESIHDFRDIDEEIELKPILDALAARPPLDLTYSEETEARLPGLVGGLSVALARAFTLIEPELKTPRPSSGSALPASATRCCRPQRWPGRPRGSRQRLALAVSVSGPSATRPVGVVRSWAAGRIAARDKAGATFPLPPAVVRADKP